MSETVSTSGGARGNVVPALALLFMAVVVGLAGWAVWSADPAIERSVIGTAGLPVAMNGMEVLGRPVRDDGGRRSVGLAVVPLYDNDAYREESDFTQSRDLRQELRRARASDLYAKVTRAPTLLVLPKWRQGALAKAVFHPTYLVDAEGMRVPLVAGLRVQQGEPKFQTFTPAGRFARPITLYAPQTLKVPEDHEGCSPVVWRGADRFDAVLLARCELGSGDTFHILSDPDLVNNHGLGTGGNVAFAREMLAGLSVGGGGLYLDLVPGETFRRETRRDDRGRSLADVLRFFEGPFVLAWLALVLFAALALWRGGVRFGRADEGSDGFVEASRASMIDADARVLRASGATLPLLERHAGERLEAAARAVFGRSADRNALLDALARRAPDKARTLCELVAEVSTSATAPAAPVAPAGWLSRFDAAVRDAKQEFGQ